MIATESEIMFISFFFFFFVCVYRSSAHESYSGRFMLKIIQLLKILRIGLKKMFLCVILESYSFYFMIEG